MFWFAVLPLSLLQLCVSKPLPKRWNHLSVKHSWTEIPHGWELYGPAPADHTMDMRIGLKQDKLEELISSLYEVSDPAHERYVCRYHLVNFVADNAFRYGAHLSTEEVQALVAPHPDSVDLVDSWLTHNNIDLSFAHRSGGSDWITLRVNVAQAESMLG